MRPIPSTFRQGNGPSEPMRRDHPMAHGRGLMDTPNAADRGTVGGSRPIPGPKGLHRGKKNKKKGKRSYSNDPFVRTAVNAAKA